MKSFSEFCAAVRKRESSNNYQAINNFGYLGAYQFGLARLTDFDYCKRKPSTIGYSNDSFEFIPPYTQEIFLNSVSIQDDVFKAHVMNLRKKINKQFKLTKCFYFLRPPQEQSPKTPDMSGSIGVCHLLGFGGLMLLLDKNIDSHDANKTYASDYMVLFSDYEIP